MACSQGTVREALLRLQEDGLVIRAGRRGTTVTPLDADAASEMLALRRRIETRGAARAAAHATPPLSPGSNCCRRRWTRPRRAATSTSSSSATRNFT